MIGLVCLITTRGDRVGADDRLEAMARDALRHHDVPPDARLSLLSVSENATFAIDVNTMTATGGGTYTQRDGSGTVIGQGTLEPPYSLLGPLFFLNGNPANCQDADAFAVGISAMTDSSAQVGLSISLLSNNFTANISDSQGGTQYSGVAGPGITGSC